MECGSGEWACVVLSLLEKHGVEASHALGWLPSVELHVRENIQALIGLLGLSFGIYKWWYFRDRALHQRLKAYLSEQDARLKEARSYTLEAINRPGAKRRFAEPLFAVEPLRKVLHKKGWNSILSANTLETGAERLIEQALQGVEDRLATSQNQLASFRVQQASAHLLKGAIAAARASNMRDSAQAFALDDRALNAFRTVQLVPGYERDVDAKEFEAHQLRKLGHLALAKAAYLKTEEFAGFLTDQRSRDLTTARCRRWRASIEQQEAIERYARGQQIGRGSHRAQQLLRGDEAGQVLGALMLRKPYEPFGGWDAIDQGDYHYFAAFVSDNLGFNLQRDGSLNDAVTEYKRVLENTPRKLFGSETNRRLRAAAHAGLDRARAAQNKRQFDAAWLLAPSQPAQAHAHDVGQSSGEQAIDEAAEQDGVDGAR